MKIIQVEKPITNQSLGIAKDFNEIMEKSCPIWAWDKRQDKKNKNIKL